MTPERWSRIKEILGAALELPEPARAAFLDQSCGSDLPLRAEVERLLAAHLSQSLESPVAAPSELGPGQTLSHYRIESSLGRGGMGAVYKAHDEKLQRPVALKVLSGRRFDSPAARQRFLREARAASAFNHPHIVTVYEAGSEEGLDYIAMEYVEGKTLDRLIPPKGLLLQQALDWAITIAGALAKAHAAGIVHRDLKPANVMVTSDGQPKLLDFGLARRVHPAGAETATLTHEGEVFGTPAYMSPEQAEGKTADERSDIFSFGVVLYEMLSGRRAFPGDSTAATLGAVLRDEPPPLDGAPAELQQLVTRCLHKDPARRLQHIDDVRLLLNEIRETPALSPAGPVRRSRTIRRVAALAVVAVCTGVALWLISRSRAPQLVEARVAPLTRLPGWEVHSSFSPDGSQVAFTWQGDALATDIYAAVVGSAAEPRQLTSDPASELYPAWSPDGRQIAFLRQRALYLIPAIGGPERRLAEIQSPPADWMPSTHGWSPDGKWLAAAEGTDQGPWRISLVSTERGEKRALMTLTVVPHAVAFSPDGRRLAYAACRNPMVDTDCDLFLLELAPDLSVRGAPRRLTEQRYYILGLAWSGDGRSLIYGASPCGAHASKLWRVSVSGRETPKPLDLAGWGARYPAISQSGRRLAYTQGPGYDIDLWRYQAGSGSAKKFVQSTGHDVNPQFSPDGKQVVFVSDRTTGCREIWVAGADGKKQMQLTNDSNRVNGTPRWSPDGRWIAFDRLASDGQADVDVMDSSGGQRRRLTPFPSDESVPSWSRDGKWVYFRSNRGGRNEIWKIPFAGGEAVQVTDGGGYVAFESWDGKTLYYLQTPVTGPLFARPLDGGPARMIISGRIHNRAFSPTEDGIYYLETDRDPAFFDLKFYNLTTRQTRVVTKLDGARWLSQGLTVSPDRKTFLFSLGQRAEADLMLIENLR